jgi:molybdopterin-binding protein
VPVVRDDHSRGPRPGQYRSHFEDRQGLEIVSVITMHSAHRLKLKPGGKAHALIKADSVILAID